MDCLEVPKLFCNICGFSNAPNPLCIKSRVSELSSSYQSVLTSDAGDYVGVFHDIIKNYELTSTDLASPLAHVKEADAFKKGQKRNPWSSGGDDATA